MTPNRLIVIIGAAIAVVAVCILFIRKRPEIYEWDEVEHARDKFDLFADDKLADKKAVFDSELVDSRPFGERENKWQINSSAAVIEMDIGEAQNDSEACLFELYPSYAAATEAVQLKGQKLLPSINMLDGKAKQFDDGLYAELDAALTHQKLKVFYETEGLVRGVLEKLEKTSDAYAWLWAALEAGGLLTSDELMHSPNGSGALLASFNADPAQSKPIGFYTWSPELQQTFRFLRFLQQPLRGGAIADPIAQILRADAGLRLQYTTLLDFYSHLTNPFRAQNILSPAGAATEINFLPYSTSREVELFERLFPNGVPSGTDLMVELVKAIRRGAVDLKPRADSGWYDYQVYALETLLLPERGPEKEKLLLSKRYKQRLLQAFEALITKRRETHARQAVGSKCDTFIEPSGELAPRLRVEPNPTYFIRQARAYAFLENYLTATLPADLANSLRGRKQDGARDRSLLDELVWMRRFFYGLHLLSCEDIGLHPALLEGEVPDADACIKTAQDWLAAWEKDADLAADTRVSVPILVDYQANKLQLWNTLGVRGAKLEVRYAQPPRWRPDGHPEVDWKDMESWRTSSTSYVILVDEFATVERTGLRVVTREELRAICDREKTKDRIVQALAK